MNGNLFDRIVDAVFIIGLLILLGAAIAILSFVSIPKDNMTLFAALTSGTVGSGVGAYVGFRWGSSKGSQAKDATLAVMASKVDGNDQQA